MSFHTSAFGCRNNEDIILISNFRCVPNVVCFLLGNSLASEFYMPTFRNTLFHLPIKIEQSVPKR